MWAVAPGSAREAGQVGAGPQPCARLGPALGPGARGSLP